MTEKERLDKMAIYLQKELGEINNKLENIEEILADKAMCIEDFKKYVDEKKKANNPRK